MNLASHPIHSRRYWINTHPAQRFAATLQRWLVMGLLGAFAWGFPRTGKTDMVRNVAKTLSTRDGQLIPRFLIPQKTQSIQTDRKFWSFVLTSLGIIHQERSTAFAMYAALLAFLRNQADQNSERRVVLFLDEAQKLSRFHYELLLDLINDLTGCDVNPLVVSVGSNAMPDHVRKFDEIHDAHLRGRFFGAQHEICGLRDSEEVQHALRWYDTPHPEQSILTSYLEDFMPRAYAAGFRLASHADLLWNTFATLTGAQRRSGWGMQYFHVTVRLLLVDLLIDEDAISPESVEMAVRSSGLFGVAKENIFGPADGYVDP